MKEECQSGGGAFSENFSFPTGSPEGLSRGDSVGVENRGEYYTLSVTFVTSQTGNINLQILGSFSNGSVYLSRLILREEKTAD
ncbi:MAG: hypothetical protein SOT34_01375 [Candidatus Borkfalkiaceae bacterium]|nr:hypothetical protein [Christensenellaceae bacterium]